MLSKAEIVAKLHGYLPGVSDTSPRLRSVAIVLEYFGMALIVDRDLGTQPALQGWLITLGSCAACQGKVRLFVVGQDSEVSVA